MDLFKHIFGSHYYIVVWIIVGLVCYVLGKILGIEYKEPKERIQEGKWPVRSFRADNQPVYWQADAVKAYAPVPRHVWMSTRIGHFGWVGSSQTAYNLTKIGTGTLQVTPEGLYFIADHGFFKIRWSEIVQYDLSSRYPKGLRLYRSNGEAIVFKAQNSKHEELHKLLPFFQNELPKWQLQSDDKGHVLVRPGC